MNRSVWVHAALLAALLVAAYLVWTREPAPDSSDVPILSLRGALDRVTYAASGERTVTVERRKDGLGSYTWLTVETWEKAPEPPKKADGAKPDGAKPDGAKPDGAKADGAKPAGDKPADEGGGDKPADEDKPADDQAETETDADRAKAEPAPEPKKVKKVKQFKGSEAADELLSGLATLSAARALGKPTAEKLAAFGLKEPKATLELRAEGTTRRFALGDNTYGNMDRYLLDRDEGRVYVVKPRLLGDFPYAEFRLMDRRLSGAVRDEIETLELRLKEGALSMVQRNARTPATAFWAAPKAPDKKVEHYANFVDKLQRLSVLEYLPPKQRPAGLEQVLQVRYLGRAGALDTLTLHRGPAETPPPPAAAGAPPPEPGAPFYAESGHTRTLVKVSRPLADELLRDARGLLK